jgi:outer membrane protein assembly factor BamB
MRSVSVCGHFLVLCLIAGAEDWPRFRGANGAGVGTGTGLPVEFGPATNLEWKAPVLPGHSSPVISGGRIYMTGAEDGALVTFALDAGTGKELWRRSLPRERKAPINKLNSAAAPTPAADAGGVVVFFQDFGLAAYSKGGELLWKSPLTSRAITHGMGSSPILAGKLVIQVLGADAGSSVLAVGRHTGERAWEQKLTGATFSTPVLAKGQDGRAVVVVVSTGEAVAFDAADGRRIWWSNDVPVQPCSSPMTSADGRTVYLAVPTIGEAARREFREFDGLLKKWDVNGDGKITRLEMQESGGPADAFGQVDTNEDGVYDRQEHDANWRLGDLPDLMGAVPAGGVGDVTGKSIWVQRRYVPQVPSPLVYQDVFYAIRNGGVTASFDARTGKLEKEGRISAGFGAMYSSPVAADGKIYAANQAGKVAVLKASAAWEVLAVNDLGEQCFATPALVGDRIYIRTGQHLWCFRQKRD